jgi:putative salt-induced outer membrane protein
MLNPRLSLCLLALVATPVLADDAKRPWDIEVDLGANSTSGNTKTTSFQGKIDAKQNLAHWENQYILSALYKKDQVEQDDGSQVSEKTAEKYFASVKSAYLLLGGKDSYLFGYGSHTSDKFGSYRTYTTLSLGYGDWLYSTPRLKWFLEAGPGYFEGEKVREGADAMTADTLTTESGAMLRVASALEWKITKTAEFKQTLSVEAADNNTRTVAETTLATSITDAMQMKVGFAVANDTEVEPGKVKTDTTTFVNLVYNF